MRRMLCSPLDLKVYLRNICVVKILMKMWKECLLCLLLINLKDCLPSGSLQYVLSIGDECFPRSKIASNADTTKLMQLQLKRVYRGNTVSNIKLSVGSNDTRPKASVSNYNYRSSTPNSSNGTTNSVNSWPLLYLFESTNWRNNFDICFQFIFNVG